ncbi:MAG: hypothetical protein K2K97_10695, partial [Muribaculaceae bacterium]|nr:hypothetical protein [Muribaculaceae bacterium]
MKKKLLFVLALAASTLGANADELTIDFVNQDYGLTRTSVANGVTAVNCNSFTWNKELSVQENGFDFQFQTADDNGGYLLINNGNKPIYTGLAISGFYLPEYQTDPKIVVTAPQGDKITSISFYITGDGMALDKSTAIINDNTIDVEGTTTDRTSYHFTYSDQTGVESIVFTFPAVVKIPVFIRTIDIQYKPDLGGKQECDLSFNEQETQAVLGETFTAPTLNNPNNLPITWSSSNEEVATVAEDGAVTLIGPGQTKIKAETAGNDDYAKGYTTYTLTVIGAAANITQMITLAPAVGDQVKINFPMTVTYAKSGNAFVIDAEGNASYIHNTKNDDSDKQSSTSIYKVGQIIPAGWIATNTCINDIQWNGLPESGNELETTEVTYPEVTSINFEEDNCKVLVLQDVTFTTATPEGQSQAFGTTPDGTIYKFLDTYGISSHPAGTYNATVVVRKPLRSNIAPWLAAIELTAATPEFPESFKFDLSDSNVKAKQGVVDGVYTIALSYDAPGEPIVIT